MPNADSSLSVSDLGDSELDREIDKRVWRPGRIITCPSCGHVVIAGWAFYTQSLPTLFVGTDDARHRFVAILKRHAAAVYDETCEECR